MAGGYQISIANNTRGPGCEDRHIVKRRADPWQEGCAGQASQYCHSGQIRTAFLVRTSLHLRGTLLILSSFTWVPVTLAYSFTSKELKSNPFAALYERLGPLDIKVQQDFQAGITTHVVAKKRNTSKGLQALIGGKHIVHNDSFVQALIKAAGPDGGPSPLAEDFEGNFPDPLDYLPPKGDEPTQRENSSYAPNPARQDMFEGYNFVFYEQRQYDILFAPISEGGGKVSLMQVIEGETTVDDFVRYVKGLAGEKGLGSFEDGTEGKGVIVVRFNPVKGDASAAGWYADFSRNVALRLDHRLIEQNEFLDAILGNDASVLRRPLEIECSGIVAPTPTAGTYESSNPQRCCC